jgi:hypothetical protein
MAKKTDEEVRLAAAVAAAKAETEAHEIAREEIEDVLEKANAQKRALEDPLRKASEKLRAARRAYGRSMPLKGKDLDILTKAASPQGYAYRYDDKSNGPRSAYGIVHTLRDLGYVTTVNHHAMTTPAGVAKLRAQGVLP